MSITEKTTCNSINCREVTKEEYDFVGMDDK